MRKRRHVTCKVNGFAQGKATSSDHISVREEVASSLTLLVTSAVYVTVILLLCTPLNPVSVGGAHTTAG